MNTTLSQQHGVSEPWKYQSKGGYIPEVIEKKQPKKQPKKKYPKKSVNSMFESSTFGGGRNRSRSSRRSRRHHTRANRSRRSTSKK